ncbi:amidohydrolase [Acidaminobacter sp.]|uniref:amidohydrolase n=1 Tax=Acidaminobacter sp. TaxID=1872102 RepID=UPI0013841280|nr:amidohydrolase [Acidaminobacter sp.]MDK9711293.1 amidohydrolase [Acidaminobacter sp.]MZQ97100.1 amidohydrolase [Acidaminobacter sp.]
MSDMLKKAQEIESYVIDMRRYFHENPELSCQEFKTQEKIMEELDALGIPYEKAGSTSLIAKINAGKGSKTVALRADTDALPVIEQSGVPFTSKNPGVMHACGHDAHTAMLLGAAKILSEMKEELPGEVRLFFQEGEEMFAGANKIIAAGGMEGVDAVFGMHGMPGMKTGYYDLTPGYRMAGCDTIYIKFEGISGHGSAPHKAKDTIHPACMFVNDIQGIVTKNVDPLESVVLSVGKFVGGTKANIVAKYTELDISMRYFDPKVREIVHAGIQRHAKAIADMYELQVEVNIEPSAVALRNDEVVTQIASEAAEKVFGSQRNIETRKLMGSEDMPFYFQHAPGAFALLGYENEAKDSIYYPHHEKFKLDEDYFKFGTALHVQFAVDFLNK